MTTLSIICPTLNEDKFIEGTVNSFLNQKYSTFDLEILITDGMSIDRTREIVNRLASLHSNIRLLDNQKKKTPFAFNLGLNEAKGEYVAILGAHTEYAPDYLQTCYDELIKTGSVGCTGRIISKAPSESFGALMVQWVMESPFGVSGSSFRTMTEGYTHSVNFAVFQKKALLELGGYDTSMHRNQDNDMNQRLLDAGHKLYCTWKTQCHYYTPASPEKMFQYGYNNGYWNAISMLDRTRSMRLYHFIPFLFVLSLAFSFGVGMLEMVVTHSRYGAQGFELILGLYLIAAVGFSFIAYGQKADLRKMLLPAYFFWFHVSYGWGTLRGLVDRITKRS